MALKGTLADMGIIDLIQFPHSGRKTGHLVISGTRGEARLSYERGALVHVRHGDMSGMDALVRVVDWNEGAFEFIPDEQPEDRTIDLDLHRAVMRALKLHDELKKQAAAESSRKDPGTDGSDEVLAAKLTRFIESNDVAVHVGILGPDGEARASAGRGEALPQGTEELRVSLHSLMQDYPRSPLNRILVEDAQGTTVLVRLKDGGSLILVAGTEASLGAVSMNASRLAAGIE
ncbi:MAG: DUF4388 domain-containing protein [Pseudomonadota bacterium]